MNFPSQCKELSIVFPHVGPDAAQPCHLSVRSFNHVPQLRFYFFLQRALLLEEVVMECCVSGGITCVNDLAIQDYQEGKNLKDCVRRRGGENEVLLDFHIFYAQAALNDVHPALDGKASGAKDEQYRLAFRHCKTDRLY